MTEKLYYSDSHCFAFEAKLLAVTGDEKHPGHFLLELDRTAFFPEGGGQSADTGRIGAMSVLDVQEKEGRIFHRVLVPEGAEPPQAGAQVSCVLDGETRWRRMQNHSGEHVFSGLVHRHYGYDNVGFHMGHPYMQIDFSGEMTWEQLQEIEREANEAVRADLPVLTSFPESSALREMSYRSKLELTENVRIVEIPGIDCCACCAPHVSRTGEIGLIKLISAERHKGGVRLELVCGLDALEAVNGMQKSVAAISNLLSAKREEIFPAAERLLAERDTLRLRLAGVERELLEERAQAEEETEGNLVCFLSPGYSEAARREMVNRLVKKCGGMAAVFSGTDGEGYLYIIGSEHSDLRQRAREINAGICGRGGGRSEMISGSCTAEEKTIRAWFAADAGKGETV